MDQGFLEKATESFVQGAVILMKQGASPEIVIDSMIGALVTVCYTAGSPPDQLAAAFKKLARQIPDLYNQYEGKLRHANRMN